MTKEYLVNLISIISKNSINKEEYLFIKDEFKKNAKEIDYGYFLDIMAEKNKIVISPAERTQILDFKLEYNKNCEDTFLSKEKKIEDFLIISHKKDEKKKTALPGLNIDKYEYDINKMPQDVVERYGNVLLNTAYYAAIGFNDPFAPPQSLIEKLNEQLELLKSNREELAQLYYSFFLQNILIASNDEFKKSIIYEKQDVGDGINPFTNAYKKIEDNETFSDSLSDDFDF